MVAAIGAVLTVSTVGAGADQRDVCNRDSADAPSISFVVDDGSALRDHIPKFGIAPELDIAAGPLTVVVFEGPRHAVALFPPLQQGDNTDASAIPDRVVCVLTPDGVENYYPGVDLSGLDPNGLAVDLRDP